MRKYLIVAPNYAENSGGIWALHKLCNDLNEIQPDIAYISCHGVNPTFNTPTCENTELFIKNNIMIYPEALNDNLGHNGRVVRYLLNKPGYCGPRIAPMPVNDFHLCFSRIFRSPHKPADHVLFIPHLNDAIMLDQKLPRSYICYYSGKAMPVAGFDNHFYNTVKKQLHLHRSINHIEIPTDRHWPLQNLIHTFNKCKLFYCFDNMTAVFKIAVMCGCPTIIMPNGTFDRNEFEQSEWGLNGLAWGDSYEEVKRAIATVHNGRAWYETIKNNYKSSLIEFIHKTQGYFL